MHKCLIYMYYQNNNISIWNRLTGRMAAGSYKGVCSIANPRQVGDVLAGGMMTERSPIAQSDAKSMFHVRAGVSFGRLLGHQLQWGIVSLLSLCCAGCTVHLSLFLPCGQQRGASESTLEHLPKTPLPCVKILIAGGLKSSNISHS